jgi:hypothetical protein
LVDDAASDAVDAPFDTPDMFVSPRVPGAIAEWRFREGSGMTVGDTVVGDPVDMSIVASSVFTWLPDMAGGLQFDAPSKVQSATGPHFNSDVKNTGAMTFEVWATPANFTQGTGDYAVVAAISANQFTRNLSLEQRGSQWAARVRTSATGNDGEPTILAAPGVDTTEPTHLVVVSDATTRTLYINGVPVDAMPPSNGSLTSSWDSGLRLNLAGEQNGGRTWLGVIWLVAIYDRALSLEDILKNRDAGHACSEC